MSSTQNTISSLVGDTPTDPQAIADPFHLELNNDFRQWLEAEGISLALTTYEAGKLIVIGPGIKGGTIVTERNFERCMATFVEGDNIWITTQYQIWQIENGLDQGQYFDGQWDRVYLPRMSYVTGDVDVHDIMRANDGHLYGVITGYNCIARITHDEKGSFSPHWKPPFISQIIGEDRCHLNGLSLENGELAYVSMIGKSNEKNGWRAHKNDGGFIMDIRNNAVIAQGLSMPHTPRLHDSALWFLEAGKGYVCRIDKTTRDVERVSWRPGFLRGLTFYKNYAFVCSSAPRDNTFKGLPLDEELKTRGTDPRCALDIIDLNTMELAYSVQITGSVKEIYDVAVLEDCKQPLLHGILGDEMRKIVVLGTDRSVAK